MTRQDEDGSASSARIHPTAIIEEGVTIGPGTSVWDHVHIRRSATIGEQCIVGGKTYIAYGVSIGDRVKINAFVYICAAVTIESGVMIGQAVTFTNDRFPRATTPDLERLRTLRTRREHPSDARAGGCNHRRREHDRLRPDHRPFRHGRHGRRW